MSHAVLARLCLVLVAITTAASPAAAQPAPPAKPAPPAPPDGGKVDAKALMQSGVRLLEAKDYLGALAVFKDAYARFPSAKILLNIGTTLNLLDRKAEAANTYQRYLDASDADPAKRADVLAALAEIDRSVGRLEITVTPADAEVQVNDGDWQPAARAKIVRVAQGAFTVRARKDAYGSEAKSAQIVAGERAAIVIAMTALPVPTGAPIATTPPPTSAPELSDGPPTLDVEPPRLRVGLLALAHVDIPRGGGAGRIGITLDVLERLEVHAAALLGPSSGAYASASFAILTGATRPYLAAGVPVFFSDGARVGLRGAGGVEARMSRRFSLLGEVGVEVMLNPEDNILKAAVIPAIGLTARL